MPRKKILIRPRTIPIRMNLGYSRATLVALLTVISVSICFADSPGVTMANYARLKTGMTYSQVVEILGKDGTEMSSTEIGGTKAVMYTWKASGLAGLTGGNMNATFEDGKLLSKAQYGLPK